MDQMGVIDGTRLVLTMTLIFFPIVLAVRYRFLSETLHIRRRSQKLQLSFKGLEIRGSILGMLVTKALFWIYFSTTILGPFLVLYATDVMGFTKTQWGLVQMVFQMTWAVTTVPCGMFADRYSKRTAVFLSLVIGTIPIFSYLFIRDLTVIIFLNFLAGIGAAFGGPIYGGGPAWQSLLADIVPSKRRARIMGLMNMVGGLSASPFNYVGAYLWDVFSPSATISMAALFSAISTFVFLIAVKEPEGT
jgi:MFS family permease